MQGDWGKDSQQGRVPEKSGLDNEVRYSRQLAVSSPIYKILMCRKAALIEECLVRLVHSDIRLTPSRWRWTIEHQPKGVSALQSEHISILVFPVILCTSERIDS